MERYIDVLSNRVFQTKDARFTASRRMKRNQIASKAAESFLSASIIALSLISLQMGNQETSKTISVFTVILSTFLLVLSLLFSSLDYAKRYVNYNDCALELNRLCHHIECLTQSNIDGLELQKKAEALSDEYEEILSRYNQNHIPFDREYSLLFNRNVTTKWHKRVCLYSRYYIFDVYFLYWMIAILPIIGILGYYVCVLLFK